MSKNSHPAGSLDQLVYQCRLPLSSATLDLVAGLVRGHLKKIGSRWRKLAPHRIALVVLAVLRHDQRFADMAAANGISASTVRRWLLEVIHLLAARATRLDRALKKTAKSGSIVVLVDGTLIPTQRRRGREDRKNYSGCEYGCAVPTRGLTRTLAGPWCLVFDLSATASERCVLAPGKADRVPIEALPPSEASSQS
ncbi:MULTISPECIES: hypothetical protein [unclassified Streptomyces]|uniref:hypothetical protein n=1 Tax=unclassified Streptomyces TaxID=2593676 RepID=UPI003810CB74